MGQDTYRFDTINYVFFPNVLKSLSDSLTATFNIWQNFPDKMVLVHYIIFYNEMSYMRGARDSVRGVLTILR